MSDALQAFLEYFMGFIDLNCLKNSFFSWKFKTKNMVVFYVHGPVQWRKIITSLDNSFISLFFYIFLCKNLFIRTVKIHLCHRLFVPFSFHPCRENLWGSNFRDFSDWLSCSWLLFVTSTHPQHFLHTWTELKERKKMEQF